GSVHGDGDGRQFFGRGSLAAARRREGFCLPPVVDNRYIRSNERIMNKSAKGCLSQRPLTTNTRLLRWVEKMADLCRPAAIHWVDGSESERDRLSAEMVAAGTFIKLNEDLWPGCY